MSSLHSIITTALSGVAGGRIHANVTPPVPTFPLVVYQEVGGQAVNFLEATYPGKNHARVQFVVWSSSPLEAEDVKDDAIKQLVNEEGAYLFGAPTALYEDAIKKHGYRFDVGIWYTPD